MSTTWLSIRTYPIQHVCETQHAFLQDLGKSQQFEEFNFLMCSFVDVNILLTKGECNIFFCPTAAVIPAPTPVDNVNVFDSEDGNTPQHPRAAGINSPCGPKDHNDNIGTSDQSGQLVPSGQSDQHGA